jgi:formylglycine-generating enzyme required for sulfatase activity
MLPPDKALAPDGGPTGLADRATVSTLRLDKYLVTVGRFRQFVSAWNNGSGYVPPAGSGKHAHLNGGLGLVIADASIPTYEPGWIASDDNLVTPTDGNLACDASYATWTPAAGGRETLPINCVSWWEAYAFCIWDGGFLPSAQEWEYAAAGGSEQREYPWGSTDPGTGNLFSIYGCHYPGDAGSCTGVTNIAPVGSATQGAGLWGQLDLVGNLWEWVLDPGSLLANPCVDCASQLSSQVPRGGSFAESPFIVPSNVFPATFSPRVSRFGFRCARTP